MSNLFLVNAPAGSGKTTFIENKVISLIEEYPNRKILCITYTNRAKEELESRVNRKKVTIATVHTFLPNFISLYKSKQEVIDLYFEMYQEKINEIIARGDADEKNVRYKEKYGSVSLEMVKSNISSVTYNEQSFSSYFYGRLSHDDIVVFSHKMFEKFPILRRRLADKYSFVFVDEYQDISSDVLQIFYESLTNTNSQLFLLGDKMQEIFDNYDGTFNENLNVFDQSVSLTKNYRCQKNIVEILNHIYNDKRYIQAPYSQIDCVKPKLLTVDLSDSTTLEPYHDFMQLYIFNKSRFEKIGARAIYEAVYSMKAYKFPSQYSPADVLLDKTSDNPDKFFRILYSICDAIELCNRKSFGQLIQQIKHKSQVFNPELVSINFHADKINFSKKVDNLLEYVSLSTVSILDVCNYLMENDYCKKDLLAFLSDSSEYDAVYEVPFKQAMLLFNYMDNQFVSTQHGVKGEGHDKVCFIAEDSKNQPITHMYKFLELFSKYDINLTDFQSYYYDYLRTCKSINTANTTPASEFELHKDYYIVEATKIIDKYHGNIYFDFCESELYNKFINKPNSSNAKNCFKTTSTKGTLWAYKLFYVGCSRARKELVVLVDSNLTSNFTKELISKMNLIGFETT